jgi:hypothetical protein
MTPVQAKLRDLRVQRTASRDYIDRASQLRQDAIAALAAGHLIHAARAHYAAWLANRAAIAELGNPDPR